MIQDIQPLLDRYTFLIQTLKEMLVITETAMKDDTRWFSFGPRVARKFLNQAFTFNFLLQPIVIEESEGNEYEHLDISSIYSTLRMLFETHAVYYHLFMPCGNIEENMLRFRLWEIDGIRTRVKFRRDLGNEKNKKLVSDDLLYIEKVEGAIKQLNYFKKLTEKQQLYLIENGLWKFTSESLGREKSKWRISMSELIKIAGLKDDFHANLYSHLSAHTHPLYLGVIQNELTIEEIAMFRFVAAMQGGFVTAFMIADLAHRFVEPKDYLNNMEKSKFEVYESVLKAGRN